MGGRAGWWRRAAFVAATALAASAGAARAGDPPAVPAIPAGRSTRTMDGRSVEFVVPAGAPPARKFSLLLAIDTNLNEFGNPEALAKDGWVLCVPHAKGPGKTGWATSEAPELVTLVDHLAAALPIARDRVHVLTSADNFGFATFVAFDKSSQAVSLCFLDTADYRGKTPPESARKRLAVLSLWSGEEKKYGDGSVVVDRLAGKVRTVEHRNGSAAEPYLRYWLSVADDRFTPGWDLSFDWLFDPPPSAAKLRAGEPPPTPPPAHALDRAKAAAAAGKRGSLVYFWSAGDAAKPEAKALQNDLLFRPEVRAFAGRIVPVKLERERSEKTFADFGLKNTPALVVLDAAFAPVKTFEGAVEEKHLLEALRKVAAPAPKEK